MIFSADSDITVVVTSCGRFDLLRRTLDSLDRFNTAPVRAVFITEDSGSAEVESCIPEHWRGHTRFWINNPRLGQLRSIDAAYGAVETPWVFHCEDDWAFYRPGFIEDSLRLLERDRQALQVWLRSAAHDLALHSPYVYLGERQLEEGIAFYRVCSHKAEWQGFSFNPGLRRLEDYQAFAPYAQYSGEKELSALYADRHALILENDAVLHTGFGEHVAVPEERRKKAKRKRLDRLKLALALVAGLLLGWWL